MGRGARQRAQEGGAGVLFGAGGAGVECTPEETFADVSDTPGFIRGWPKTELGVSTSGSGFYHARDHTRKFFFLLKSFESAFPPETDPSVAKFQAKWALIRTAHCISPQIGSFAIFKKIIIGPLLSVSHILAELHVVHISVPLKKGSIFWLAPLFANVLFS